MGLASAPGLTAQAIMREPLRDDPRIARLKRWRSRPWRSLVGLHVQLGRPLAIPDAFLGLNRASPVPTRAGDVILMHKHTIHGSLPNGSDEIRCSLNLRYNPNGQSTGRPEFPGFVARAYAIRGATA